jgi:hypothetical protein
MARAGHAYLNTEYTISPYSVLRKDSLIMVTKLSIPWTQSQTWLSLGTKTSTPMETMRSLTS